VEHTTFTVERVYAAAPGRTFAAWSDPEAKSRWYSDPDEELELDFRVGGYERHGGTLPDGREYAYRARFWDIVPDRRIVYTYEMVLDGIRISVSVATAEFTAEGDGTRLTFTEQGAFLDGHEVPGSRANGMGALLDELGRWLDR
jgi:uncharacterized protein YndB with AHSA1/START domain